MFFEGMKQVRDFLALQFCLTILTKLKYYCSFAARIKLIEGFNCL